jgi:multicomponent Na+:H+ antiporter subunit F
MEIPVAVQYFLLFSMVFLGVTMSFCLLRGILGPRFTDRVVAVNIIGSKTILLIAALSIYLEKPYLLDVCLIFSTISFLSVVVLTNTYMWEHSRKAAAKQPGNAR